MESIFQKVGEKLEIKFALDKGAYAPEKAYEWDAGFDLRTPINFELECSEDYVIIDTGVHVAIPEGYVGFLKSKSGLNTKLGITSEGVIDAGYTGSIIAKLYRSDAKVKDAIGNGTVSFRAGDKVTQLVILPIPKIKMKEVQYADLVGGTRGINGFGSSGR